jgi:hypothetical protein
MKSNVNLTFDIMSYFHQIKNNEEVKVMSFGFVQIGKIPCICNIVMKISNDEVLVTIANTFEEEQEYLIGTQYSVNPSQIEDIAETIFYVGEEVVSKLSKNNNNVYVVTGFEERTNRVICRDMNEKGRVRYAYKPKEIRPVAKNVTLTLGKRYVINNSEPVLICKTSATIYEAQLSMVCLTGDKVGHAKLTVPVKRFENSINLSRHALLNAGIKSIREM